MTSLDGTSAATHPTLSYGSAEWDVLVHCVEATVDMDLSQRVLMAWDTMERSTTLKHMCLRVVRHVIVHTSTLGLPGMEHAGMP